MQKIRILLADDNEKILETVQNLLDSPFDVVGHVTDGEALVESAIKHKPDVIVSDISMPKLSGIQAVGRLRESGYTPKVVFLTVCQDPETREAAIQTGALGYVLKHSIATDLLVALDEAVAGRTFSSL
jgi:DNA-binding NarL/FixJ family response regulator